MDGLPVTVRLLDPPLHEFLPDTEELAIKEATVGLTDEEAPAARGGQDVARVQPDARHPRRAPRRDQARPLRHAGPGPDGGRRSTGWRPAGSPIVEIMIPLTVTREELALARSWVETAVAATLEAGSTPRPRRAPSAKGTLEVLIGTMIETPRAALRAGEIAEEADFFSLRHQRPDPDDLRLQPRRRRGPDDVGLPRAGAAQAQPVRGRRPRRRRRAGPPRRRAGPGHPAGPQGRRVRRARRRPRVDRHLRRRPASTT